MKALVEKERSMQKQALHIAYLFASPLIMRNRKSKTAKQVMKIDFEKEFEQILESLSSTHRVV